MEVRKKRKRKPKFSLSDWDYKPFWAAALQKKRQTKKGENQSLNENTNNSDVW